MIEKGTEAMKVCDIRAAVAAMDLLGVTGPYDEDDGVRLYVRDELNLAGSIRYTPQQIRTLTVSKLLSDVSKLLDKIEEMKDLEKKVCDFAIEKALNAGLTIKEINAIQRSKCLK